jgi:phospholipid/cholesterol/gamma-HCH transport system ATP-binding protein
MSEEEQEGIELPEEPPLAPVGYVERSDREKARTAEQDADEFRYHTGTIRPSKEPDAIEFIDVHKSFGRNTYPAGSEHGSAGGQISMILGPSGTGKSVCIKHIVGLLYPDEGDVIVHGRVGPEPAR